MRDYKLTLNLITNDSVPCKTFKQFDSGNEVELELYENEHLKEDKKVTLTNEKVLAFFQQESGAVIQKNAAIKNGNIFITTTSDVLGVAGSLLLECVIMNGDKKTTTQTLQFTVNKSIDRNGAVKELPQWDIIDALTKAAETEQVRLKGEETRKVDELDRKISEIDRKTSEDERKAKCVQMQAQWDNVSKAVKDSNVGQSVVTEVIASRTNKQAKSYNTLGERIDNIEDRVQSRDYTEIETKGASVITLANSVEGQGKIVEIQGNTLVNLVQNGNFSNGTTGWGWSNPDNIVSVSNNEITYTATAQYAGLSQSISNYANYANHKLYYRALVNPTINSAEVYLVLNDGVDQGVALSGVENQYALLSGIRTVTSNPKTLFIKIQDGRVANWTPIKAKDFMVVDLTAMYGAGNEPTKEVFDTIQWFDGMKSVDRIEVLSRGRNLIKNSNEISILPNNVGLGIATKMNDETVPYWRVKATSIVSTYENVIYDYMSSNATVGKEYTISCDVRIPNTGNVGFFNEFGVNFNIPANTWTRIFYTFTYSCKTHRVGGHVYNGTQLDYRNWQLEEGTTSRPYTQYQEDKINILTSKSLKKWDKASGDTVSWGTSEKVLESSDITLMYSVTNLDWACIKKYIDGKDSNQYTLSALLQGCTCGNASDNVSNIGSLAGDGNITSYFVGFPKGTTLEQAKNFLVGKKLIYQLATPIIEKLQQPLTLSSFENGSMVINSNIPGNVKYAYPTNLSSAVASLRDYTEVLETQLVGVWKTSLGLADRELKMKAVPLLATETTTDLKNKLNEILNVWR